MFSQQSIVESTLNSCTRSNETKPPVRMMMSRPVHNRMNHVNHWNAMPCEGTNFIQRIAGGRIARDDKRLAALTDQT